MSTPALDPYKVVGLLAVHQGMRDFRYFAGRETARTLLSGSLNPQQAVSGWLHGPRRQGKSSLAHFLEAQAREQGFRTVYADVGRVQPGQFDELLQLVVDAAPDLAISGGSPRERFMQLARSSTQRPIFLILDEFDHIAVDLRLDEQAFLRSLAETYQGFCYLFITRLDPSLIIEDVSQPRSRLLGICAQARLSALEKRDVRGLCERVAEDLKRPAIKEWWEPIWSRVGGHPAAVMTLLHALAAEELGEPLSPERIKEVLQDRRKELEPLLTGLWEDLKPGTRSVLLQDKTPAEDDPEWQDARQDGYGSRASGVIRPSWLLEVGRRLGEIPEGRSSSGETASWERVERMHRLMGGINKHVLRSGYKQAFMHTDETISYFPLLRVAQSEEDFKAAVEHLHKVLHEGSRHPKPPQDGNLCRLPPALKEAFTQSIGYKHLIGLRNLYDHNAGQRSDLDRPSSRYEAQGEFFEQYCGNRSPRMAEDWQKIRDGLVKEVLAALEEMETLAQELPPSGRTA